MARGTSSQLRVGFVIETNGLRTGFQKATRETDKFGRSTGRTSKATSALGSTLRRAAIAAAGAAAAYVSIAQARRAIETTQELALTTAGLRRNLGMATKEASRWAAVTKARGIDARTLTMSFTSLSRQLEGVREGSESSIKVFRSLGITEKQLAKTQGNFTDQVGLVAEAFGNAEGGAKRQAAAQKLLGRGYRDILPMFTEGAEGLREQLKWADEFGVTMGRDTVQAMSDFTTAQRRGKVAIMGLQIAFAKAATPAITEGINALGDLAAILNDPKLSRSEKIARLRQEFERFRDRVLKVVRDLAPAIAESAGKIGVELAKGIGRGFIETGLLGKVAIGVLLARMFGGWAAIGAAAKLVGSFIGLQMGTSIAAGATAGVAGGAAGGAAAGGAAAGIAGALGKVKWARVGMIGVGIGIADVLIKVMSQRMAEKSGDVLEALTQKGFESNFEKIIESLKVDGSILGEILGSPDLSREASRYLATFFDSYTKGQAIVSKGQQEILRNKLRDANLTGEQTVVVEKMLALFREGERLGFAVSPEMDVGQLRRIADSFQTLRSGSLTSLQDIDRAMDRTGNTIRRNFGPRTAEGRKLLADNMRAGIQAIRKAEREGTISSDRASKKINSLYRRINLVDPTRKQAQAMGRTWAQGFRDAGRITGKGVANIIGQARKMPGPMRKIALETMLAQVNAAKRAGKLTPEQYKKLRSRIVSEFSNMKLKVKSETQAVDRQTRGSFGRTGDNMEKLADAAQKSSKKIKRSVNDIPGPVRTAYSKLGDYANQAARAFGSNQQVSLRFRGGGAVSGGSRQLVPAAVSPGELISYRGREIYVPGRPEPRDSVLMNLPVGAKVYTFDGQRRLASGASPSEALRKQLPHFNAGGTVGDLPRPRLVGGATVPRATGQAAIDRGRKQAQAWTEKLKPSLRGLEKLAAKFGLQTTSGYRAGDDGYHGVNRARDFSNSSGPTPEMLRFAKYVGGNFGRQLLELIYTPLGWSIKNGAKVAPYAQADHYDHVHVALRKGGRVRAPWLRKYKRWTPDMLTTLAHYVRLPNPSLMGRIAMGESGGNPRVSNRNTNGTIDRGLWQINSVHGYKGDHFDPLTNAIMAKRVHNKQGVGAWYAPPTGPGGSVDEEFLNVIHYSPAQRKAAKTRAAKAARNVGRLRRQNKQRGNKRTRSLARSARKAARNAARWARKGDVRKARRASRRADRLVKTARAAFSQPPKERERERKRPGSTGTPDVNELLRAAGRKGIGRDVRESLLSNALSIAQGTEGTDDDLAVLRRQRTLQTRIRDRARRTLANINKTLRKGGLTPKKRRRLLERRREALEALGSSSAALADINSQIAETKGGTDAEKDLATAIEELTKAIQEQNALQSSVQATSSREAIRMLSDVISGQIVGKRSPVGQTPTAGVRY